MNTTTGSTPFPTSETGAQGTGLGDNGMRTGGGSDDTIARMKQSAHDAVDRIADKAAPAVERMRSRVNEMSESMHARSEEWSAMQDQWMESCRATVREHPLATVAVALAAGVLLSKILSSR